MALDGAFLRFIKTELEEKLIGLRVEKVFQPNRDELIVAFRGVSGAYKVLMSARANSPRVNITQHPPENPQTPPMLCMLLRKRLTGARLKAITQHQLERVLRFTFDATDELGDKIELSLIAEIMGKYSNVIFVDGSGNVRDMGGWKTASGKTVKYGMLYRGKNIDNATYLGVATLKNLGIKTEFDLRYSKQKFQKEGTGFNYIFLETNAQYDHILQEKFANEVKANYKKIFEVLSNSNNYPIYTHCSAGADRTGTYAFILNGLLGVSYEDLTRDFELTSFSSAGKRWRGTGNGGTFASNDLIMKTDSNYVAWGKLYQEMMNSKYNTDGTLSNTIQNYLVNYVGVPQSQIDSFKSIMLG